MTLSCVSLSVLPLIVSFSCVHLPSCINSPCLLCLCQAISIDRSSTSSVFCHVRYFYVCVFFLSVGRLFWHLVFSCFFNFFFFFHLQPGLCLHLGPAFTTFPWQYWCLTDVWLMFIQKIFLFKLLNQKKRQQCVFAQTGLISINHLQFRKLQNWFGQKDSLSRCCFNVKLALTSWVRRRRSVVADSSLAPGDGCCRRKWFYTQSGIDRASRSELKTPLLLTAAAAQHNSTVQPEAAALIPPPALPKQVSSF